MAIVYSLTHKADKDAKEIYVTSSKNIFDIIDTMFAKKGNVECYHMYITDSKNDSIPYEEWRLML